MKKKTTFTVALLAGAVAGYSQGTISFANHYSGGPYNFISLVIQSARLSPPYTPTIVTLGGSSTVTTGIIADAQNGGDWTIELYGNAGWNDPLSTLIPAPEAGSISVQNPQGIPTTATLAGVTDIAYLGQWYSTAVADIPGVSFANQPATVQLYAWYNGGGRYNSYSAALAAGEPTGFSATANVITGGPQMGGSPLNATPLPVFQDGGAIVGPAGIVFNGGTIPEPSTFAFGILGLSTIFLRLRKTGSSPSG
ncbi:MAG TPA: hypothetical protein VGO67_14010 [Verrucomicrobiae bacterium]|jgi:hypothetical protein